jgi:hypothetical protein
MIIARRPAFLFSFLLFFISILSVSLLACKKTAAEEEQSMFNETIFHKGIGKMVPTEEATQWTANLQRKSRSAVTSFTLPADAVRDLLKEKETVGILFYYGKQHGDKLVLLPVAIRADGSVIKKENLHSTSGLVKWDVAKSWKMNYNGAVKGHFEGASILEQLLSSGFGTLRISTGLSDAGDEKMYFSNASASDAFVADETIRCPPVCPRDTDVF